jgi:hypothetical protein
MIENPELTAQQIFYLWDEWQNIKPQTKAQSESRKEHWLPPPSGWFKVNSDGAFVLADGAGRGCAVLRDH